MNELTLATPTLLFSAVSLILLAYTNRFMGYAQVIRSLYEQFLRNHDQVLLEQIRNLRQRLYLTRAMQLLGILSMFFCVAAMFLIYIGMQTPAAYTFGGGLLLLIASLAISVWEIQISVQALDLNLKNMEKSRQE
jgi:hypothetical protein